MIKEDEIKDNKESVQSYLEYTIAVFNNTEHWHHPRNKVYLIFKKSFDKKICKKTHKIKLNMNTISRVKFMKPIEIELSIQNHCDDCKLMRLMNSNISEDYEQRHCEKYQELCRECVLTCEIILHSKMRKILIKN